MTQVIVWQDKSFAHCDEELGVKDMLGREKGTVHNGDYGKYIFGGAVLDMGVVNGAPVKNTARTDPTQWAWSFAETDRGVAGENIKIRTTPRSEFLFLSVPLSPPNKNNSDFAPTAS